jgi:hypothetical protein
LFREGNDEEFVEWLRSHYLLRRIGVSEHFVTRGAALELTQARNFWNQGDLRSPQINAFLAHAQARLTATSYVESIDIFQRPPGAYVHVLQTNEELLRVVSAHVREALDADLIVDWVAGNRVGFRIGDEPRRDESNDRVSERYGEALQRLPRLDSDGDGVRSFVGTLLATFCGAHPVLLIDEPEAFLHPPQAPSRPHSGAERSSVRATVDCRDA